MAKQATAAPRFYEVVFRGKPKVVKAFLKGLMMGTGIEAPVWFSFDEGVHHEGKAEMLMEMVGIRGVDCHVITNADGAAYLKQVGKRIEKETGLKMTGNRSIRSATMTFEYHAYARQYNDEIVKALKGLPQGLKLQGYTHDEKSDPSARGVEAYTVAHDYEASGAGTVTGRIDLLIEAKRALAKFPLIKTADINLNLA